MKDPHFPVVAHSVSCLRTLQKLSHCGGGLPVERPKGQGTGKGVGSKASKELRS